MLDKEGVQVVARPAGRVRYSWRSTTLGREKEPYVLALFVRKRPLGVLAPPVAAQPTAVAVSFRQAPFEDTAGDVGAKLDFEAERRGRHGLESHAVERVFLHTIGGRGLDRLPLVADFDCAE